MYPFLFISKYVREKNNRRQGIGLSLPGFEVVITVKRLYNGGLYGPTR
jgi:hypothetical protein